LALISTPDKTAYGDHVFAPIIVKGRVGANAKCPPFIRLALLKVEPKRVLAFCRL